MFIAIIWAIAALWFAVLVGKVLWLLGLLVFKIVFFLVALPFRLAFAGREEGDTQAQAVGPSGEVPVRARYRRGVTEVHLG